MRGSFDSEDRMKDLTPEKARIFRITHVDNLPWILKHGLHSRNSRLVDPNFVGIGSPELIERRARHRVPVGPGGTLADYVSFYFTPRSPMLLNIKTGQNVAWHPMESIAILVSSLHRLARAQVQFVCYDRHAYLKTAQPFTDLQELHQLIDWPILQASDFKHDPEDPAKMERYQAEALAHRHVPVEALLGIACRNPDARRHIEHLVEHAGVRLKVAVQSSWYF